MPYLAERYATYEAFARATLAEIYTPQCLQEALRFEVNSLASACFLNDGTGRFDRIPLPRAAQLAPIFALAVTDVDDDGAVDLYLGQNFFGPQRETGPLDGGVGVLALGRGDGTFVALRPDVSGVVVPDAAMAAAAIDLNGDGRQELCVATNDGPFQVFGRTDATGDPTRASVENRSPWVEQNLALAQQFFDSQQFVESLPYLRRAVKVNPESADALFMLAQADRQRGRLGDARKHLENLQQRAALANDRVQTEWGRLLTELKQLDRASETLSAVLARFPRATDAHRALGHVRVLQGRLTEARDHFKEAGDRSGISSVVQQLQVARLLLDQGELAEAAGREAEALRFFEQSRRLDARPQTLAALARLLESTGDPKLQDPWMAGQLRHWLREVEAPPALDSR